MRTPRWHAALLVATTTLLVSCADSSNEPATNPVAPSDSVSPTAPPGDVGSAITAGPDGDTATSTGPDARADQPGVAQAMADFAERNDVDLNDVTITDLRNVTWRDGALGCPKPGMQYSQALTPGQQLIFSVTGHPTQTFAYHAGSRGVFTFCESPQPPVEGAPGST